MNRELHEHLFVGAWRRTLTREEWTLMHSAHRTGAIRVGAGHLNLHFASDAAKHVDVQLWLLNSAAAFRRHGEYRSARSCVDASRAHRLRLSAGEDFDAKREAA